MEEDALAFCARFSAVGRVGRQGAVDGVRCLSNIPANRGIGMQPVRCELIRGLLAPQYLVAHRFSRRDKTSAVVKLAE
jgi:hypothetical protein